MGDIIQLKKLKPQTEAERATRTSTDTLEITQALVKSWKRPPFQRLIRVTDKVMEVKQEVEETHVLPGVLTLGVLDGLTYVIDGQHRIEAYLMSGVPAAYVDVRVAHYKSMGEMAAEYYKLNSRLSSMKPDDYLRALESSEPALGKIRRGCKFVGYDNLRRNPNSPILSMSTVVRVWWASAKDAPTAGGISAVDAVRDMSDDEANGLIDFLTIAYEAWGADKEYARLWSGLNLGLCMWLFRRVVLTQSGPRVTKVTRDMFKACLTNLSADSGHLEWLQGRNFNDMNRSPAYKRIKGIFVKRLQQNGGPKPVLPEPDWVKS